MAIFHVATNTPPKVELIADWIHRQSWGPDRPGPVEIVGGFHLDDPDGEVGMQVFVVAAEGAWYQVPLTYRATPMSYGEAGLIGEMQHSVLGRRFVYDGVADPHFTMVLAGTAISGYGQALGFAQHDGRWYSVPDEIIVTAHGGIAHRVAVDGLVAAEHGESVVLTNDQIEMTLHRRLIERPTPEYGLSASWAGVQGSRPLVEARPREQPASGA